MIALALLAAAAAPTLSWPLTADGLGPVRIGMTQAQVSKAVGKLVGEAIEDEKICVEKEAARFPGVGFLFEDGRLARVSIGEPSRIATAKGIRVGATAAEVRRAYGPRLKAEKNAYDDKPAEYLTWWTVPGKRGIRFETDNKRKVYVIHGGGSAIQYIEGCA
jgi:hypothetical protein